PFVVATWGGGGYLPRCWAPAPPAVGGGGGPPGVGGGAGGPPPRRTDRDMAQLDALLARREEAWAAGDAERFVAADATFHLAVVAASHNEVLSELYADLGHLLRDWLRDDVGTELLPENHMDHARLVEAIRAGDARTAASEAAGYPFICLRSPARPGG
ncbi:FadR/GntR family transcriptional regulator, partial [Streptomyces sp. NPDC047928]|uniref:FadR/GntR family transcriptional regulator n=1 Tax=Streptomyces sp. NPDC047928 TaxID=3365492 RepID=UPI0037245F61